MTGVLVETASGRLRGRREDGVSVFLGVPYAAPPVGERRFRRPGPHPGWSGVREATAFGHKAPQNPTLLDRFLGTGELATDEDCLTLNVFTPACDGGRRPVLVWIHGGAFVTGTSATSWFSGHRFCTNHDVVVVTVNYRLGALGFLHLADLAGERFAASGNLGLCDQIAALGWVREHAGVFGGDPDNVTVFGESAGGASVMALLAAPSAHGLFHRAIGQSPSFTQLRSRARADEYAANFLGHCGLSVERAAEVASLPVEALLDAQARFLATAGPTGFESFAPTPDGLVLPADVRTAVATGAAPEVPVLLGTTLDEMHLFTFLDPDYTGLDRAALVARAAGYFGDRAEEAVRVYEARRPHATPGQLASAIATDQAFRQPAIAAATGRAGSGAAPTWMYLFEYASTAFNAALGACHGLEIPFVFDNLDQPGVAMFTGDGPGREAVAAAMHADWAHFARTGSLPWPAYEPDRRSTRVYGGAGGATCLVEDPLGDERRCWSPVTGP